MKIPRLLVASGFVAVLVGPQAWAANGWYHVSPSSMSFADGAGGSPSAIDLPNSGAPKFGFTVVVPPDIKPDTTIKLRIHLELLNICTMKMSISFGRRFRAGKSWVTTTSGIAPVGGLNVSVEGYVSAFKTFTLKGLNNGPIQGLKGGDRVIISLARDAESTDDTCAGTVLINGIDVIYRKR